MRASLSIAVMGLIAFACFGAHAETDAAPAITPESIHIQRCSACHYVEGQSPGPEFPNIAGQYDAYLKKALRQFKENRRDSDAMELIASLHKQQELVILANYYAEQRAAETPSTATPDPSLKARGERLFRAERVYGIACVDCHGADARGYLRKSPRGPAVRAIPRLAGQRPAYLHAVIQKYRDGSVAHGMCAMRKAGKTLSQDDVQALVEYLSSK